MPRALCLAGMIISVLIFLLFLLDLVLPEALAPFKHASRPVMDIVFVICAAILAYLSYTTLREQT